MGFPKGPADAIHKVMASANTPGKAKPVKIGTAMKITRPQIGDALKINRPVSMGKGTRQFR
jgi:hypothetical protein